MRHHDVLADILASAHQPNDRSEISHLLCGLGGALDFPLDGRIDPDSPAYKLGQEMGEAMMKLVPADD